MLERIIFYKSNYFKYFSVAFFLYNISVVLSTIYELPISFYRASSFLFILFTLYFAFNNFNRKDSPRYILGFVVVILSWNIFIIIRGLSFDFRIIGRLLVSPTFFLPYVVPFFVFIKKDLYFIKILFRSIIIYDLLYLFFLLIAGTGNVFADVNIYETLSKQIAFPNCFLLLCYFYQKKRIKVFTLLIFNVSFLIVLLLARRNQIFTLGLFAFFALLLHLLYFYKKKFIVNILIVIIFCFLCFIGYQKYASNLFSTFTLLIERIDSDTRKRVEDCYYDDIKTIDYVIGKGMAGQYYCPDSDFVESNDARTEEEKDYRSGIETGYLDMVLKGGIISLSFFALICMAAVFKGLFFSKNGFIKASALLILVNILAIGVENSQAFTFRYILVWLCIGICFSKQLNQYTDKEIRSHLNEI